MEKQHDRLVWPLHETPNYRPYQWDGGVIAKFLSDVYAVSEKEGRYDYVHGDILLTMLGC